MSCSLYHPSGVVPPGAKVFAAACLALALPIAGLYAWLILHLPDILNFFVSFAFAFAMACLVKRVCAVSKVRNPRWMGRFGLLLGMCGWYFQWAAWLVFRQDADLDFGAAVAAAFQLAAQPAEVLNQVMSAGSSTAGVGSFLAIAAWLGESWMSAFFPHYMGKMRAGEPFDEHGGRWADYVECPRKFRLVDQAALLRWMTSPSESLPDILVAETDQGSRSHSKLRIYPCLGEEAFVSVVSVDINGKDGSRRVTESAPGNYLRVSTAELDSLLAKAPASSGIEESDPPELARAIECLQADQFKAAYQEALPFVDADDRGLHCDANRICAIACSESRQWLQAVGYWKTLFVKESTAHNALQLATSTVMAGEVEQGLAWMERARALNATSQEMPDLAIITNVLGALTMANHMEAAMPLLEQLRDFYARLHVTDPTFLFGHRIPLFHVFLEKSAEVVNQVLDKDASRAWYAAMLPHLDERGKAELTAWLDGACAPA